jgi:hypothetical protein
MRRVFLFSLILILFQIVINSPINCNSGMQALENDLEIDNCRDALVCKVGIIFSYNF